MTSYVLRDTPPSTPEQKLEFDLDMMPFIKALQVLLSEYSRLQHPYDSQYAYQRLQEIVAVIAKREEARKATAEELKAAKEAADEAVREYGRSRGLSGV